MSLPINISCSFSCYFFSIFCENYWQTNSKVVISIMCTPVQMAARLFKTTTRKPFYLFVTSLTSIKFLIYHIILVLYVRHWTPHYIICLLTWLKLSDGSNIWTSICSTSFPVWKKMIFLFLGWNLGDWNFFLKPWSHCWPRQSPQSVFSFLADS